MIEVVSTWDEFRRKWDSRQNLILRGEVFPYRFASPALADVVETVRRNEHTRIITGKKGTRSEATSMTSSTYLDFRDLPIAQAVDSRVQMSHFELNEFTGPGQLFDGLGPILSAWYQALADHGFTLDVSQRAMFLSGPDSQSNYHMDGSYIVAWQIHGRKQWNWLKDPERWCGPDVRREIAGRYDRMEMPAGLTPDDVVSCVMEPGDVLWNVMLTPHWVASVGGTSYSFNLVHTGLRCDGRQSDVDREYDQIKRERERARAQAAGTAM